MQIAIIQFPGSNCERETMLAVRRAGVTPVAFLWNEPKEKLQAMDGFILVGGFSYEDRSRAGIIAALDPVMQTLQVESELGKPILGICNGAQILVETGLVPGLENNKIAMALTQNKRIVNQKVIGTGFYNEWVNLRLSDDYQRNAFTRYLTPKEILSLPIAHAEGRFVMNDALLAEVKAQGLNIFQYCNHQGDIMNEFPVNPNGSLDNIAAIANKAGNVMAIMPHPERTTNGDAIFRSMRDFIAKRHQEVVIPLHYYPRRTVMAPYQKARHHVELIVALTITDNEARTVQQTLHQQGMPFEVKRLVHWELEVESDDVLDAIKASGVLYNERKETVVDPAQLAPVPSFLVRAKDDIAGREAAQLLQDAFLIEGITAIQRGILWQFSGKSINIDQLLQTHIIHNPYAHECYQYNNA